MAEPKRPMDGLERVLESLPRTAHTTNVRAETVAGEITCDLVYLAPVN